ncbi:MAG: hypothetical protein ACK41F_11700 [Fimbriimonadaceae bacterium]
MKGLLFGIGLLVVAVLAGCGGQNAPGPLGSKGEGNIPIGKLKSPLPAVVSATDSSGWSGSLSVASDGTVFAPSLSDGEAVLSVEDSDGSRLDMPLVLGPERRLLFVARLHPKQSGATCTALRISLANERPIPVGRTVPIKVVAEGVRVEGLQPSLWVSGGVGSVLEGNRFVATRPGEGSIEAELLGVRASLPVTVSEY